MNRTAALLSRLRRRLAAEDGIALIVALGVSVVMGISVTTTVAFVSSNSGTAARSNADQIALALAEAALNNAYATLYAASNPSQASAVSQQTASYEGGTATWSGSLAGQVWTLTGVGRVKNPAGPGMADVVRTVGGRVRLGSSTRGTGNNAVWNYIYSDDPSACMSLGNSVTVNVPLYVRGSLCMSNTARMTGYALQVAGTVSISNSALIGSADPTASSGNPANLQVHEVHIAGGCRLGTSGPFTTPCTSAQRVYSEVPPDANVGNLSKPPVDLPAWYRDSKPGPLQNCTTGSFPGGFDTDTVMNRSRATVNLTPSTAYDCRVYDPSGNLLGQISWTPGSPGSLVVAGTIFFDGDIEFAQFNDAVYQGKATIYSSGTISFQNQSRLCGVVGCGADWNANQNLLAFVAGSSTDQYGFSIGNFSTFQGAVYAVNDFREGNNTTYWGPIIARQVYLQNSTSNHYVPIGTPLPGMPATYEEAVTLTNEAGSWG